MSVQSDGATEHPEQLHDVKILSLSTEFPNPSEPGKGLFVRARLGAIAARTSLTVVAPVALLDYANPRKELLASLWIPTRRRENGIDILHPRWFYPPHGGWVNAFFLFARLLWPVARLRARDGYDAIDAHYAHPEGIAAVLVGRVLRMPVMVTLRGSELRYRRHRYKLFWIGWALRRADRVIAVSEGLRQLALDLGVDPRRTKVIPNGIAADIFYPRDRHIARLAHDIGEGDPLILCAGDLAELKGHHRVIRALKALVEASIPAQLLIVGGVGRSGRYAAALHRQVDDSGLQDRVRFVGEVTQTVLAELMSAADVFCLASSSEGWPNVVNEALACGTPVVATDVGAVRQMLPTPQFGCIVPVDAPDALVEALRMAVSRTWDRDVISRWGRSRSWDAVAEDVLEEVRAIVSDRERLAHTAS
jgi:teichuronic acid biosynthesis glycosyltransferase TuaC